MSWQFTSAQGLGTQNEQQDCLGAWPSADGKTVLVILADGAGGHHGGQQAAQAAVEMARSLWQRETPAIKDARAFRAPIRKPDPWTSAWACSSWEIS